MAFYTNHTRFPAIVMLRIDSTVKPSESLMIGAKSVVEKVSADVGYHDFLIGEGKEIYLGENTVAVIVSVRSAP